MINKSIAFVDDKPDLLNMYSKALKMNGYNDVSSFTDALVVYKNIQENLDKYSLLIIDDKMADVNGYFLVQTIRNKSKTKCDHIE